MFFGFDSQETTSRALLLVATLTAGRCEWRQGATAQGLTASLEVVANHRSGGTVLLSDGDQTQHVRDVALRMHSAVNSGAMLLINDQKDENLFRGQVVPLGWTSGGADVIHELKDAVERTAGVRGRGRRRARQGEKREGEPRRKEPEDREGGRQGQGGKAGKLPR